MNLYEKCDKLFYGHTGWIYAVCCDPGGAPFSGSNDNTIRSWYVKLEENNVLQSCGLPLQSKDYRSWNEKIIEERRGRKK
jgi:WD40 repeat protein